jgi:hypothetical protein
LFAGIWLLKITFAHSYIRVYKTTYQGYEGLSDLEAKQAQSGNAYKRFFVKLLRVVPAFNIEYWNLAMLWFGKHPSHGVLLSKHHLMMP